MEEAGRITRHGAPHCYRAADVLAARRGEAAPRPAAVRPIGAIVTIYDISYRLSPSLPVAISSGAMDLTNAGSSFNQVIGSLSSSTAAAINLGSATLTIGGLNADCDYRTDTSKNLLKSPPL